MLPYEKLKQQGLITFSYINKYVQWATSSEQWHPALWSPEKFLPRPSGSAKQRGWGKPWCSSPQWKPSLSHAEESSHLALPWKTTQEGLLSPSLQTDVSMRAQFQHFRVCSPADTKRMMDSLNGLRCQAGLDPCGDVATSISQAKVSFVKKKWQPQFYLQGLKPEAEWRMLCPLHVYFRRQSPKGSLWAFGQKQQCLNARFHSYYLLPLWRRALLFSKH